MISIEQAAPPERGWRGRAACRPGSGVDPELFFPTAESGPARVRQVAAAKTVCAGCPVRARCLDEALVRIPDGIAGGLTEHERRTFRIASTTRARAAGRAADDGWRSGLTARGMARDRARVGRALLASGRSTRQVARACGVTTRTVERWATPASTTTVARDHGPDGGGGEHGGNRAPLRISTAHDTQAGTRAPEGARG